MTGECYYLHNTIVTVYIDCVFKQYLRLGAVSQLQLWYLLIKIYALLPCLYRYMHIYLHCICTAMPHTCQFFKAFSLQKDHSDSIIQVNVLYLKNSACCRSLCVGKCALIDIVSFEKTSAIIEGLILALTFVCLHAGCLFQFHFQAPCLFLVKPRRQLSCIIMLVSGPPAVYCNCLDSQDCPCS